MNVALDELHRFGIKIFFEPGTEPDPRSCIPVFHHWIQDRALQDLLIDVADYTHLDGGPSVVLVGHEANLSLDFSDQRAGLLYMRKRPDASLFDDRWARATRALFTAGRLLEREQTLDGHLQFRGNELQFVSNDRLVAPANESVATELQERLQPLVAALYPDMRFAITSSIRDKDRLRLSALAEATVSLETLLSRTG